eukprot:TRINITY_DN55_c0_g2_i5.p1 TRINITY_DN55_c0_g2~~TRINITY_DN55_c0_g2_i5.p1  ORF type:complete len:639 (+),score=185.10 TRINITY_DN55_c0_g2_i5:234-2150(+)
MYSISEKSKDNLELQIETEFLKPSKAFLHASIVPPKAGTRKPSTFVCAIDISGSMDSEATVKNSSEADKFSRLDLVKHSIKTVINMLTPEDNICLIPFSTYANVSMPIQAMDEKGKEKASKLVESLSSTSATNIWDALRLSIDEVLKSSAAKNTNNYILLFTDGEPNENPPEGIVSALEKKLRGIPNYQEEFTIHIFGYGHSLDGKLLCNISILGNGIFDHIPDSSMIGTTFVNFLGNILSTSVANAKLTVTPPKGVELKALGFNKRATTLTTGPIQFGQTRDFIFEFKPPADKESPGAFAPFDLEVTLSYGTKTVTKKVTGITSKQSKKSNIEWVRLKYCQCLLKELAARNGALRKKGRDYISHAKTIIAKSPFSNEEQLKTLIREIESPKETEGRVTKAFKSEYFSRWGAHYVRSLVSAHQLQTCHNFKDPGVQIYGGDCFKELQDKADAIFCSLPAPVPSLRAPIKTASPARAYSPPRYMSNYMSQSIGCFDGEGEIVLSNGKKKVKELKKGDEVICAGGEKAKVVALVVTKVEREVELVELNGVKLTRKHPVRLNGQWHFPMSVKKGNMIYCDAVYNLVLDRSHIVVISGLEVVTLGHGFKDNAVIEHKYYGSQRVISDLKEFEGWEKGKVMID